MEQSLQIKFWILWCKAAIRQRGAEESLSLYLVNRRRAKLLHGLINQTYSTSLSVHDTQQSQMWILMVRTLQPMRGRRELSHLFSLSRKPSCGCSSILRLLLSCAP